jgi:hypothetical protein
MAQQLPQQKPRQSSRPARDLVEPANPVLFVAAGPLAAQTVKDLSEVADVLHVRLSGQFGYVTLLPSSGGGLTRSLSAGFLITGREDQQKDQHEYRPPYSDADPWDERLRSLMRQLRPDHAMTPFGEPAQSTLKVYAIFDLRNLECVKAGLQAIAAIRREPLDLDLTGVLLTGRTAHFHAQENEYQHGLKYILDANRADCLLHRLYVLDGKTTKQYWLQSEADMARVAAECIWHHGFAPYSAVLRKHERTRLSARQPIEEVLGSLHVRVMRSDRAVIQGAVAWEVRRRLFSKEDTTSPASEGRELEAIAKEVGEELAEIYESNRKKKQAGSAPSLADQKVLAQRAHAALEKGLRSACGDRPSDRVRPRLRRFFEAFRHELSGVQTRVLLIDRRHMRQEAYEGLRQAAGHLGALPRGAAFRTASGQTIRKRVRAHDLVGTIPVESRVRPVLALPPDVIPAEEPPVESPEFLLPRPPSLLCQIGGLLLLVLGAGTVWATLGMDANHLWLALAGVLVLGGASWLNWPPEAVVHQRTAQRPFEEDKAPWLPYRMKVGVWRIVAGVVGLAGGIALGIRTLRVPAENAVNSLEAWLVLIAAAGAGVAAFVPRSDSHVRGVARDTDDLASLLYPWWRWIAFGVLLVVWASIVATWSLRLRAEPEAWVVAASAGTLLTLGIGLLTFPLTNDYQFIFCPPPPPQPDWRGKQAPLPVASEVEKYVLSLRRWTGSLLPERSAPMTLTQPGSPSSTASPGGGKLLDPLARRALFESRPGPMMEEEVLCWPYHQRGVGSVLDAVVPNWPSVLCDACLTEVRGDVNDPQQWVDCLLAELDQAVAESLPMEQVFALHLVKKWMEGRPLQDLLALLKPNPHWLERYFEQAVAPLWSVPTQDYDIKAGVVALDRHLSELAALEDETAAAYRLVRVEWAQAGLVVLARLVQGVGPGSLERMEAADEEAEATAC